jgi:hypothetical protein
MNMEVATDLVIDFMEAKGFISNENSFSKVNLVIQALSHAGITQGGGNFERVQSAVLQLIDQHILLYNENRSLGTDGTVRISFNADHEDKLFLNLK